jgi:transposase, IS605 OrfB family, central region
VRFSPIVEQVITVVCKLQPTPEQASKIDALLKAFADACNWANQTVKAGITSKTTIQNLVYQQLRKQFGLSANQAVRVCARVGANRKTAKLKGKSVKAFAATSADYDARIFAFREKDWKVSLTLLDGREHIQLNPGNYQRGKLKSRVPTSAQLCQHRDGQYYIHIQLTNEGADPIPSERVIGVDFGRRDIAVTSIGDKWDGKQIQDVRDKFAKVRTSLQKKASKGTRSTRRRARQILQRLSGRERRYQTWLNHNISKLIVLSALQHNAIIAIEDLTGIRERTNEMPRNKTERRRSNSGAFFQLRMFLSYKSVKYGVEVAAVNPAYTSQTCHNCLHIHPVKGKSYRSAKAFKCGHCGNHCDADENGSKMISIVGAVFVNPLRGSVLSCDIADHIRATESPRFLAVG